MLIATRIVHAFGRVRCGWGRGTAMAVLSVLCLLAGHGLAFSQTWPARTVTMIVPFPPGGNTDTMARLLAQKLTEKFGQSFIVDNRVGASGSIGAAAVARAAPDGYTFMFGAFQQVSVLPYTEKVSYDPKTQFSYVSIFGEGPFVFGINTSVPAKSLQEFIAYAKQHPGVMSYASGGIFSGAHLVAALLFKRAGINLQHVPYRGGGPAISDLLGNHVQAYFGNASELIPIANDPRVRILATSPAKRMVQLPDVPLVSEFFPGFVFSSWNGVIAPAGTPQAVQAKLEKAIIEVARDPQVIETLGKLGITAVGSTSAAFTARIADETSLLADAIKAAQ
jgi:tripartite-type tricarboxylate transporter receptor subunit TctC